MINASKFQVLSFDCYGTLIDWERGIVEALMPVLSARHIGLSDEQVLELYAELEAEAEQGSYVKYREVLRRVVQQLGSKLGFVPYASELDCIADSLKSWIPFPDTVEALETLKRRFRLAIISNIDDDLFAFSAQHLKVEFDWVITAEQVKAYKPSSDPFEYAIDRVGLSTERMLHIAQSIYHDIVPAKAVGLSTVWVNRRKGKSGPGAIPPAQGQPDLEVTDLKALVTILG